MLLFFCAETQAKQGVNIFAYSRKVPDVAVYNPFGKAVKLDDFAGDFLIVVFWSKSCIPCIQELDNLNRFAEKTKNDGIKVVLVSAAEDWYTEQEQKNFLLKYGASDLDFYVDKKSSLAKSFGIFTSPHTVLINEESMEIGRVRGAVEWDDDDIIEEIYKIKSLH